VNEFVDWLRERPHYDGQIVAHRPLPARDAAFADIDLEPRLDPRLPTAASTNSMSTK